MCLNKKNIEIWNWDKKPRTLLRYIKVGDIVCYEMDKTGDFFGYGQLIADMKWGFALKIFKITHINPNDITLEDILDSKKLGRIFIIDSYATFDRKYTKNGEWRIIGREKNFKLEQTDIDNTYFVMGIKGMLQKINLLGESQNISDKEQDNNNYIWLSPLSGDLVKEYILD